MFLCAIGEPATDPSEDRLFEESAEGDPDLNNNPEGSSQTELDNGHSRTGVKADPSEWNDIGCNLR